VRVHGTAGSVVVRGDAIRGSLGSLRSNLFTVEPKLGGDGLPAWFIFVGAGWGHGVGLDQSGAAGMAAEGLEASAILAHYYGGVELRRIY
jgi:stage II sporulation protein D